MLVSLVEGLGAYIIKPKAIGVLEWHLTLAPFAHITIHPICSPCWAKRSQSGGQLSNNWVDMEHNSIPQKVVENTPLPLLT